MTPTHFDIYVRQGGRWRRYETIEKEDKDAAVLRAADLDKNGGENLSRRRNEMADELRELESTHERKLRRLPKTPSPPWHVRSTSSKCGARARVQRVSSLQLD